MPPVKKIFLTVLILFALRGERNLGLKIKYGGICADTANKEQNGTVYKILMPFYSATAKKYFFDVRTDERNVQEPGMD